MSAVFYKSDLALLDHVNRANGYATVAAQRFTVDTVGLSKPADTAGTWMEETSEENTYIRISAKPTSVFKGATIVTYNRLNLGDFDKFRETRPLPCYQPVTTHDLLSNILYYFSLYLGKEEVIDEPVTLDEFGKGTVTVRMIEDSLILTGEITFDVIPGGADMKLFMDKTYLDGLNYPVEDPTTQVSALLYTYPLDLSEHRDILLDIEPGILPDLDAQAIVDVLKLLDKAGQADSWNANPALTTWSLQGATVVSNGLNNLGNTSNQKYKYVMELTLRDDVVTPSGSFFLHYSDPFDPNVVDQ